MFYGRPFYVFTFHTFTGSVMKITIKNFFDNMEELFASLFLFVTLSLVLGAAAGFKGKMHVGVDFLVDRAPVKIRGIIKTFVAFILLFINMYITYISVIYLRVSHTKPTPVLGVSSAYISTAIFAGFALMTLYSLRFVVVDIIQIGKREA